MSTLHALVFIYIDLLKENKEIFGLLLLILSQSIQPLQRISLIISFTSSRISFILQQYRRGFNADDNKIIVTDECQTTLK